ncbi:PAS domain-containing protein [Rhodococcus sp. LB1]|uniref:PAS domain-containing protein n=1 Tax=Rhodococcus sp. LB1 TaxID=1807499 RepID=UPI0009EE92F7|nr:PAS domain-containing protein [Rhodococcus sp. LB1]
MQPPAVVAQAEHQRVGPSSLNSIRRKRVGSFRFFLDGQRWEWSDAVAQMHGYLRGEVTPTTELLLSRKHLEDHPHVARVLDRMISAAEPFSSTYRILDTAGRQPREPPEAHEPDSGYGFARWSVPAGRPCHGRVEGMEPSADRGVLSRNRLMTFSVMRETLLS